MRKQISYVHGWVEIAPSSPLIHPNKASNAPKLETIAEEGSEKMEAAAGKWALYLVPVLLSFASYLLIKKVLIV